MKKKDRRKEEEMPSDICPHDLSGTASSALSLRAIIQKYMYFKISIPNLCVTCVHVCERARLPPRHSNARRTHSLLFAAQFRTFRAPPPLPPLFSPAGENYKQEEGRKEGGKEPDAQ